MRKFIRGNVWTFGDHVDTDVITPGKYENLPFPELCTHCLEPLDPEFASGVSAGDVIVAGENFGCGSAREIAPRALKELGIGAVLAKSFARTFFRNAMAIGLPLLVSRNAVDKCRPKDVLSIDITRARIRNVSLSALIEAEPIQPELYQILVNGGLFIAPRKTRRGPGPTSQPKGRQ